MNNSLAMGGNF